MAHGVLTAGLISAVLGTQLPGPGSIYMSQTLKWLAPVRPGEAAPWVRPARPGHPNNEGGS